MRLAALATAFLSFALPSVPATFTVNRSADVVDASPGDGFCETAPAIAFVRCVLLSRKQELLPAQLPSSFPQERIDFRRRALTLSYRIRT